MLGFPVLVLNPVAKNKISVDWELGEGRRCKRSVSIGSESRVHMALELFKADWSLITKSKGSFIRSGPKHVATLLHQQMPLPMVCLSTISPAKR